MARGMTELQHGMLRLAVRVSRVDYAYTSPAAHDLSTETASSLQCMWVAWVAQALT